MITLDRVSAVGTEQPSVGVPNREAAKFYTYFAVAQLAVKISQGLQKNAHRLKS